MKLICLALLALAVFAQDYVKIPTNSSTVDPAIKAIRDFGASGVSTAAINAGKAASGTYKVTRVSSIQTQTLSTGVNYQFVAGISNTDNSTYITANYIVFHAKDNSNKLGVYSYTVTKNSGTTTTTPSTGTTTTTTTTTPSSGTTTTTKPTTTSKYPAQTFTGSGVGSAPSVTNSNAYVKRSNSAYKTDPNLEAARDYGAVAIGNALVTGKKIYPGTFDVKKVSSIEQRNLTNGGIQDRFVTTFSSRSNTTYIVANYTVVESSTLQYTLGAYTYTVYTNKTSVDTVATGYDANKVVAYTYDGDIAELIAGNFDRAVAQNEYVHVKFWLKTCPNCKMWKGNYTDAITELKNTTNINVFWAEVESTDQPGLFSRFGVTALPTNWLFVRTGGVIVPFDQPRRTKYFVQWVKDTIAKYEKIRTASA